MVDRWQRPEGCVEAGQGTDSSGPTRTSPVSEIRRPTCRTTWTYTSVLGVADQAAFCPECGHFWVDWVDFETSPSTHRSTRRLDHGGVFRAADEPGHLAARM